jgi:transmembrane sensor
MSELARKIEEARRQVRTDWSEERARTVERAMLRRRARRAATRVVLAAAAAVLLVVGAGSIVARSRDPGAAAPAQAFLVGIAAPSIRLADGTLAAPLDKATDLAVVETSPNRVVMSLARGRAAFDVTPNPSRAFVVLAGVVDVQVLGTRFTIESMQDQVKVAVQRGHVRVTWANGSSDLMAGQQGAFPPPVEAAQLPNAAPADSADGKRGAAGAASAPGQASGVPTEWRGLAGQGDFATAYDAMKRAGAAAVRDDPADLLLAADVARMSGHSSDAVVHLRALLSAHRSDPRASLAAFTLGRVLLDELGRPAEAAAAFADARRLAPGGALAQDALAREVEALSKAGDSASAHERALEYLRAYPDGRRARSVRKFGGVE